MYYSTVSGRAVNKYNKANYDNVQFRIKKGSRDKFNECAARRGKSLAQYITDLILADNPDLVL